MSTPARQLFDDIENDVAAALDSQGGAIVDAIREDLNIPVVVTTGPRGGRVVLRSKPGEHPRRETGALQAGVFHEIERDGSDMKLVIADEVEYAKWLDPLGAEGLKNRPIVDQVLERFEDPVLTTIANAISGTEE